jgi:tetratricopeptide (TPR) repeat protein
VRFAFEEPPVLPSTLKLHEPECWIRLGTIKEWLGESEAGDTEVSPASEGLEQTESEQWEVMLYGIEIEAEEGSGSAPESEVVLNVFLLTVTETLANIWHLLGLAHSILGDYDRAAACCRLSALIYYDLDDTAGLQQGLEMLSRLGATKGDLEMIQLGANSDLLLRTAREQNDRRTELGILLGQSETHLIQSDYRLSREKYNEALELARAIGDIVGEGTALDGLARLDWISGNLDSAATLFGNALGLYRRVGHREGQARILSAMGDFELARFDPKLAAEYYNLSLELYHELHIPSGQIEALKGLGSVALDRSRYDEAIGYFQRAATLATKLRMPETKAGCLSCLAEAYSLQGKHKRAREIYQEALKIYRHLGDRRGEANTLCLFGNLAVAERKFEEASEFFTEARDIFASLNQPEEELKILFGELSVLWQGQDSEARIDKAQETLNLAMSLENLSQEARARMELGLAYSDAGRHDQALALLEEVIRLTPNDAIAVLNFGHALHEAGDYERSIEFSKKAYDMDQTQNYALRNIGHAYLALGQPEKAEPMYRKAIDQAHEGEDFVQTIKTIKELLERQPDTPRGAEFLALFEDAQAKLDAGKSTK